MKLNILTDKINHLFWKLSVPAVLGMIGFYGTNRDIAVLGTCMTFLNLAFVPLWGISQALQPVLGVNYGVDYFDCVFSLALNCTVI